MADKVTHFPTPDNLSTKPGYVAEPMTSEEFNRPPRTLQNFRNIGPLTPEQQGWWVAFRDHYANRGK